MHIALIFLGCVSLANAQWFAWPQAQQIYTQYQPQFVFGQPQQLINGGGRQQQQSSMFC